MNHFRFGGRELWYNQRLKLRLGGVPVVAQWLTNLRTMRLQVRSLALISGLRLRRCRELWCRLQTRLGSCVAVAVAEAGSCSSDSTPGLGTSICCRSGPRNGKKTKKKREKRKIINKKKEKRVVSEGWYPAKEPHPHLDLIKMIRSWASS